ncbi:hypothetical protein BD779DRAFT_1520829 [Infundibulicybe gibba]|nr:hypothetical protein BD779DRAFT_1520829 [Infundibulicybe gibba]
MPPRTLALQEEKPTAEKPKPVIIKTDMGMQASEAALDNPDLTIYSSDGVHFKVHTRNLVVMCGNFPRPGELHGDHVELPETSEFPRDIDMPCALQLAAAAEKYQFFRLMEKCYVYMRDSLESYPAEVLSYATTHKYRDLIPDAVRETLPKPLDQVACSMYPEVLSIWIQYYYGWVQFCQKCVEASRKWDKICCSLVKKARGDFAEHALLSISSAKDIAKTILVPTCSCAGCQRAHQEMHKDIVKHLVEVPTYESFLVDFEDFRSDPT